MTRYKLTLEYNGTNLIGWQANEQGPSVQSLVADAIFKFSGQRVDVVAAGRTDAGVHALGMVAHFDLIPFPKGRGGGEADGVGVPRITASLARGDDFYCTTTPPPNGGTPSPAKGNADTIMRALNFYLTQVAAPVAILDCEAVGDDFHARFSCVCRNYRYIILNRRAPAVLDRDQVWWIPRELDIEKMRAAAARLIGNHDFTSFRAAECQAKSPVKTLDEIEICKMENVKCKTENEKKTSSIYHFPSYIALDFSARSFLHHQVRNMVGTLVEIGLGKPFDIDEILAARDRRAAGPTAPPSGLYFVSAEYATSAASA